MNAVYAAGTVSFKTAYSGNNPGATFGFTGGTGNPLGWVTVLNGAGFNPIVQADYRNNTDFYEIWSQSGDNTLGFTAHVDAYRVTITYTLSGPAPNMNNMNTSMQSNGRQRLYTATREFYPRKEHRRW